MTANPAPAAPRRQNRWALAALIERTAQFETTSQFAVELESRHSTVFDALSGRRDVSTDLLERMAATLDVDVRAIAADPYGIIGPLTKVAARARALAPHLNGHDFGLRQALADLDEIIGGQS